MLSLELLAPARNLDIGIAAIDSGADAVYIAGPFFGARKDAGNSMEDIAVLCEYAHKFGARIFVTVNIILQPGEEEELHRQMLSAQAAGVDAFIVRDERIFGWEDITVPLHASTQCAIRTVADAKKYEALGASRIILERELSLAEVEEIRKAVSCEIEFFVHGALCVGYSGECRLSEYLDGRSADRGECIHACRSLYDLLDASGKVLVRNKALLSLKDFNLYERLAELASAGICSFKIEGRLKNASYVRNITRWYSQALDNLVAANPSKYRRASFGKVSGGFSPDPLKTFNRGYTELYIDGKRGKWSSMDAPSNLGAFVGTVAKIRRKRDGMEIVLKADDSKGSSTGGPRGGAELHNGDGFAFINDSVIVGFRGDVCEWPRILCKPVDDLREGTKLYRNADAAFERELEKNLPKREIKAELSVAVHGRWNIEITAESEDGRKLLCPFKAEADTAENRERAASMLREQLSKRAGHYNFDLVSLEADTLPFLSVATINSMRRLVAEDLDAMPCGTVPMLNVRFRDGEAEQVSGATAETDGTMTGRMEQADKQGGWAAKADDREATALANEVAIGKNKVVAEPLMRSRYCIKYELGMCPVHQGAKDNGPLFLFNNGRRLALKFDCKRCEMSVWGEE
jgi:collagenase-like PrtC family protease